MLFGDREASIPHPLGRYRILAKGRSFKLEVSDTPAKDSSDVMRRARIVELSFEENRWSGRRGRERGRGVLRPQGKNEKRNELALHLRSLAQREQTICGHGARRFVACYQEPVKDSAMAKLLHTCGTHVGTSANASAQ